MRPGFFFRTSFVFFLCAAAAIAEEDPRNTELFAAESGLGTAVVLGEPMAVSVKLWISQTSALDAGVGWSFYRRTPQGMRQRGAPYAYIEYLYHFFDRIKTRTGKFVYFIGAGVEGAYMDYNEKFQDRIYMGLRLPFGLTYMFTNAPLDIYIELAPSVVVMRGMSSDTGAGIGLRYWIY